MKKYWKAETDPAKIKVIQKQILDRCMESMALVFKGLVTVIATPLPQLFATYTEAEIAMLVATWAVPGLVMVLVGGLMAALPKRQKKDD